VARKLIDEGEEKLQIYSIGYFENIKNMLEFILEFSYMKIDMSAPVSLMHFSQIACKDDPDLHNFLGPSLTLEKFQVFVAVASILSVRFPHFFYPRILSGLTRFYRLYIPQLQKKFSNAEIAKALLLSADHPDEIVVVSKDNIPAEFTSSITQYYESVYFVAPIKYTLHLVASRKAIPKKGKVLIPFSEIHELVVGIWEYSIKMIWEPRDFDITFEHANPKALGFPHEGLFFRTAPDLSVAANLTNLIILPAIKQLYISRRQSQGAFQITPLDTSGDFKQAYLPQLPPCFANPIKKCFQEKTHIKHEHRFPIFNFLFGIGIPYEVVEEMWKNMVLNSRDGGELRWKSDLQPKLKDIHKKHTAYWKDKEFFIGGCEHVVTKTKISCPIQHDIEDLGVAISKCKRSCGQEQAARSWNPIAACKSWGDKLKRK
jgi:hypothetical protein